MDRNLPSLDLIRGFEAAARHLSFTKAAAELFVTQSAVSRQVKALEQQFGVPLFLRRHRALLLTEAGQMLYRCAADTLRQLNEIAVKIRQTHSSRTLTVSCTIGFASLWLVPRLADYRASHPDVDIRIAANNRFADLERDGIELAIRYCPARAAPPSAIKLFGDMVLPVCSPRLLSRSAPLEQPEDLRRHVLLHYEPPEANLPWLTWTVWLEVVQLQGLKAAGSIRFTQYDQLIQAAIDGHGVALGLSTLVKRLIKQGKLCAPLDKKFESSRAYHIIQAAGAAQRPDVKDFIAWLVLQAKKDA